jgi:hypothetical protein
MATINRSGAAGPETKPSAVPATDPIKVRRRTPLVAARREENDE